MTSTPNKQTEASARTISPAIAIFIVLAVVLIALAIVRRVSKSPAIDFTQTPPPVGQALQENNGPADTIDAPKTLTATVTYRQDNSLTVMATIKDNPSLTLNRVLIVALHSGTEIMHESGKLLTDKNIEVGSVITATTATPLQEPVLIADKVIVK